MFQVNAFKQRKVLVLSLNDANTAVEDLHNLLNIFVAITILVIWLIILGTPILHFLIFITSQLLLLVFIFGNTCKTVFEAIIFLFVMHPFDVGDRCEVDGVQVKNSQAEKFLFHSYWYILNSFGFTDGCWRDEDINNRFPEIWQPDDHLPQQCAGYQGHWQFLPQSRHGRWSWFLRPHLNSMGKSCPFERTDNKVCFLLE